MSSLLLRLNDKRSRSVYFRFLLLKRYPTTVESLSDPRLVKIYVTFNRRSVAFDSLSSINEQESFFKGIFFLFLNNGASAE